MLVSCTIPAVTTQEAIPEEGGYKKKKINTKLKIERGKQKETRD